MRKRKIPMTGQRRKKRAMTRKRFLARLPPKRSRVNLAYQGLLAIERKFLDCVRTSTAVPASTDFTGLEIQPSSGCTDCLSAPSQGDGPTQRDGHKINILSIYVSGFINLSIFDAETSQALPSFFIALILNTQTNGAAINSEDVYQNLLGTNTGVLCPQRNMTGGSRFRVLKKRIITTPQPSVINDGTNGIDGMTVMMPFKFKINFPKGLPVTFTIGSTTADVANVVDNSISLICGATITTLNPTISYTSRIRFVG